MASVSIPALLLVLLLGGDRLHGELLELGAAVAGATHHEDGGVVEDAVERAQQRGVAVEELAPLVGAVVACEDGRHGGALLVAVVDDVEEQVGLPLVELAAPHLVDDQARGLGDAGDGLVLRAVGDGGLQLGLELAACQYVGLVAPQAALPPVGLGQVRLADARRPDEGDVGPGVEVRQRRQPPQCRTAFC